MRLVRTFAALAALLAPLAAAPAESRRPSIAEIHFRMDNPCPVTGEIQGPCKGYVIDHVIPRVCGGAEAPENMQWQTLAEAKEKDRWEKIGCRKGRKLVLPGQEKSILEAFGTGEGPGPVEAETLPPK
jgi:hypothetical protein